MLKKLEKIRNLFYWVFTFKRLIVLGLLGVIVLIFYKCSAITQLLLSFKVEDWELVRKYLQTIFSWPIIILTISLWAMIRFSEPIEIFLRNIISLKAGPVELQSSRPKQNIEPAEKEITFSQQQLDDIGLNFSTCGIMALFY